MRTLLATAGFLLIVAFFLTTEHRAHLFGALPYLLLLACPFLHAFAHGGHGHGGESGQAPAGPTGTRDPHQGRRTEPEERSS